MLHVGVVVMGAYFCLTSLFWLIQTTARYYHARQSHVDFHSTLSSPCCRSCGSHPVDGLTKMALAAVLSFAEFSFDRGYPGDHAFLSRLELGTIYAFLLFSGVMDVLTRWGSRTFYKYADYAGLVLFFVSQVAVLQTRAYVSQQPVSSLQSLAAYTASASIVVTVVEGVQSEQVLAPVARSYLLLLQGAWWLQSAVLVAGEDLATQATDREDLHQAVVFFSVLFCIHAALSLLVVVSVWLLVGRLVEKGKWGCFGGEGVTHAEDVFLENRVRFNYHVLSRLDSESE